MKTKNLIKLLPLLIIITLLITPTTAITETMEYHSLVSTEYSNDGTSTRYGEASSSIKLNFLDLLPYSSISSVICGLNRRYGNSWNVHNSNVISDSVPCNYYIGAVLIGTGTFHCTIQKNNAGSLISCILTNLFDTGFNSQGYAGAQRVTMSAPGANFYPIIGYAGSGTTVNPDQCPYIIDQSATRNNIGTYAAVAYSVVDFEQTLEYQYTDEDLQRNIDIFIDRNNINNDITITGNSNIELYGMIDNENIQYYNLFNVPYNLIIDNPYVTSGTLSEWEFNIPEDYEDTNIATLTHKTVNGDNPSEILSADFHLLIYNETTSNFETLTHQFEPSQTDYEIPNNAEYELLINKTGYIGGLHSFYMSGDRITTTTLYKDYGLNSTVLFKIRAYSTGKFIEGVKIIANGITKYTPYNGNIAFTNINESISYIISKTGYVSVSGTKEITENEAIFITLLTEEQAETTPTPTPIPTPEIDQPTNLIESIQFAFQKMFGLSGSLEDLETSNLLMGLGIIFAGAVLIASITKDALGAVVGGLIGFIMSLALGFIPLWVLFVGFASFAIYIILTKTGGSE